MRRSQGAASRGNPCVARRVITSYSIHYTKLYDRIDVRLDRQGIPNIIELNPLPGILPRPEQNSCFPKAARAAGLSYEELILGVVEAACDRLKLWQEGDVV